MSQQPSTAHHKADLNTCAQEPIHIPGSIQPHGFFLALQEPELVIRHASMNCEQAFTVGIAGLIGEPLTKFVAANSLRQLLEKLKSERLQDINPIQLELTAGGVQSLLIAVAHRSQGLLILELEPPSQGAAPSFSGIYQRINAAIEAIGAAQDLSHLYRVTTDKVKALSGYQRVMIYEFDSEWNGRVVAEAREPHQEPFLGLHYPASDIPEQARLLYQTNWLRTIPNVHYTPSPIVPSRPIGEALDLSSCNLRSVSPMHIQYLKNMGVGASTSVSVIKDGQLWGLIALHHEQAAYLSYEVRQGLEFIGRMFSSQLAAKQRFENMGCKAKLKSLQSQLTRKMKEEPAFLDGLRRGTPCFLDLAEGCTGGAILHRGELMLVGNTPSESQMRELAVWLKDFLHQEPIFHSATLAEHYQAAVEFKDTASGLLVASIPEVEPSYVMWFKPEVIQTVNWGGNPHKAVEVGPEGAHLTPRRSFALWQETVSRQSLPWQKEEIEAVEELRRSIIEVDLKRQIRAAMASNAELDQFASVISHDLKEPLRGIGFFADFLQEDLKDRLEPELQTYLTGIKQMSDRAKKLVTELYEYSKIGRVDMSFAEVDLNRLLEDVSARLKGVLAENGVKLRIPQPLPTVFCDRVRTAEVFANLISNAAKYNSQADKRVEVGAIASPDGQVFYVRDNGIGISDEGQERVFGVFERLHEPSAFGGGTGVGLAIVKRIVDRHGGRIWIESQPGEGSTFYFTLRPEKLS